jgi:transposase-like protein
VLAIGDCVLGFWGALREVLPDSREQRCWVHKIAYVLDAIPSSLQAKVKAALHTIMNAENKEAADLAIDQLEATYAGPTSCWRPLKRAGAGSTHPTWSRAFALGRPVWTA